MTSIIALLFALVIIVVALWIVYLILKQLPPPLAPYSTIAFLIIVLLVALCAYANRGAVGI